MIIISLQKSRQAYECGLHRTGRCFWNFDIVTSLIPWSAYPYNISECLCIGVFLYLYTHAVYMYIYNISPLSMPHVYYGRALQKRVLKCSVRHEHDDVIKWKPFFALLALCAGNSHVTGEFRAQRPVTLSFDIFFDLRLNKPLSKQSWGWWFETPSRPLL